MGHDYHEGAPNYNKYQLFYDGCAECKMRSDNIELAIAYIKDLKFAWARAWRHANFALDSREVPVSKAEAPVLRVLYALQVRLERHGLPMGLFPADLTEVYRASLRTGHNPDSGSLFTEDTG